MFLYQEMLSLFLPFFRQEEEEEGLQNSRRDVKGGWRLLGRNNSLQMYRHGDVCSMHVAKDAENGFLKCAKNTFCGSLKYLTYEINPFMHLTIQPDRPLLCWMWASCVDEGHLEFNLCYLGSYLN